MAQSLLIVFSKDAISGRTKTRLAATIGSYNAQLIYLDMLEYTRSVLQDIDTPIYVYTLSGRKNYAWGNYFIKKQFGEDLGEKMKNAFYSGFDDGFEKVVLIGSDNFEIKSQDIKESFNKLDDYDVVLGPSKDGGYYLVGMNMLIPQMFKNIEWGTENVLSETINILEKEKKNYTLLRELSDCDIISDVPDYILKKYKITPS